MDKTAASWSGRKTDTRSLAVQQRVIASCKRVEQSEPHEGDVLTIEREDGVGCRDEAAAEDAAAPLIVPFAAPFA
jgi:hypothetical protein